MAVEFRAKAGAKAGAGWVVHTRSNSAAAKVEGPSQNSSNDAKSVIPAKAGIQETWDVNSPQMRLHAAKCFTKRNVFMDPGSSPG